MHDEPLSIKPPVDGVFDVAKVGHGGAAPTLLLKVGTLGNVRTQTLRAYSVDEMRKMLDKMP